MIFEFILVFIIYLLVVPTVYYLTEIKGMPKWLNFKPFICRLCMTFWSLLFAYVIIGLSFGLYWLMGTGIVLTILNVIAMHIDQRNKTVKI